MLKLNIKSNNYVHTKCIICIAIISLFITSTLLIIPNFASAVSYQSSNNIQFNLNPTISISITGGDLSIANLVPGSVSDSNTIDVTVASNAVSGYTLSSTVGTSTNTSNELRKDGTDTTNKFANLTANQSTLSGFSDNEWGYSYSTDNGSTWISGDIDSSSTGYNGYTYTTESETITHLSTSTPDSTTIKYKIGAKAGATQLAGNYTNTINFTAITKPNPEDYPTYMQNLNPTLCTTTPRAVVDNRDNEIYIIQRLADDNCWMLDNLRLDLTNANVLNNLSTTNTNVDEASLISLRQGNRANGDRYAAAGFSSNRGGAYSAPAINTSGSVVSGENGNTWTGNYTKDTVAPRSTYGNGSSKIGIYYGYCAASAGNYCYGYNAGVDDTSTLRDAEYDLCPKGWRMPTGTSGGEYQALYVAYGSNVTDFKNALSTPRSGLYYSNAALYQGSDGRFWSATRYDTNSMYLLQVSPSGVNSSANIQRTYELSIRCLLDS